MDLKKYRVSPDKKFKLSSMSPDVEAMDDNELKDRLQKDIKKIAKLQNKLYAENRQSLLVILQGMDSAGKDSTIKQIMQGVNPQGVIVHSFKHPSTLELEHDFLWRHIQKLPERGQITVFNRSHYENVLISKVHPELVLAERLPGISSVDKIGKRFWAKRYEQINAFEKHTIESGTHILKFFLHISKEEQCRRFLDRIENKEKHWKFSSADITERGYWDDYQRAYQQALRETSTKTAPWYVIPANNKLFAHLLIGKIILEKLEKMNPSFPPISEQEEALMKVVKEQLLAESGGMPI